MRRILYLLPFVLYTIFYLCIIILEGTIENLIMPDIFLLLTLLLLAGVGTLSDKKIFNVIGIISLFTISFVLIKMGIENDYFILVETKVAIAILLYYLILFIIGKNKRLIIMSSVAITILAILFVPQKRYVNDGGSIEYRAIAYKYIKWNILRDDGNYYISNDLHWFPNNFYSLEYYKPIEIPNINAFVDNQQILCNGGSFQWSKTVDGQKITTIGDSFINPVYMIYQDSLIVRDDNIVKIDTSYNISNVEYVEYKEEYANNGNDSEEPIFTRIDHNGKEKSIDLKDLKSGLYIISFTINNDKDYADYSFKVEVKK